MGFDTSTVSTLPCEPAWRPPERDIEREVATVHNLTLSPALQQWVDTYETVGHRDVYLWKWCRRGVEVTTLPCVPEEERDHLADTKVLGVMLDVLIDDVADEGGEDRFLDFLLEIPGGRKPETASFLTAEQRRYAELTRRVWEEIQSRVEQGPRYEEFCNLLRFDYGQLFNAMRYAHLLNSDPALLNLTEHDLYLPHNMHMMVSSTMDLMFSPGFDHQELGVLREAVSRAQYMGRIGNLVTTWEREVAQRDFTSGVFAAAISAGALTPNDLHERNPARLEEAIQASGAEEFFLRRWHCCRQELLLLQPSLNTVDVGQLAAGLQQLLCLHLGSRGRK